MAFSFIRDNDIFDRYFDQEQQQHRHTRVNARPDIEIERFIRFFAHIVEPFLFPVNRRASRN